MQVPLEISYREITKTDALEDLIREKAANLEKVCNYITSCRVAIEKPQAQMRTGSPFRVRLEISVPPGHRIIIRREPGEGSLHDNLSSVVRSAFDAARRELQELVERQRGRVKSHPTTEVQAVVARIFRDEGYGFIRSVDGRDVYFHQNAVLRGDWERLEEGSGVRFDEAMGEDGPQATSVQIVSRSPQI